MNRLRGYQAMICLFVVAVPTANVWSISGQQDMVMLSILVNKLTTPPALSINKLHLRLPQVGALLGLAWLIVSFAISFFVRNRKRVFMIVIQIMKYRITFSGNTKRV